MNGAMLLQTEELLHYNFSLRERHNFDWLLGFSYTRESFNNLEGVGKGSPSNYIHYVVEGMPVMKDLNGVPTNMHNFRFWFSRKENGQCLWTIGV